jgi:peptidyl-Lys metalloendopeptidase
MRIRARRWAPAFAAVLLAACAAGEIDPADEVAGGLAVQLDAASVSFAADETPWIDVTYINTGSAPLRLLAWTLPSEQLWEDLFTVSVDGAPVAYIGRVYHRPEPREQDYVVLAPGESRSGRVDLSRLYDFSRTGEYEIAVKGVGARAVAANRLSVHADGRARPLREDQLEPYYYGISYAQCSSGQKRALRDGMDWADAAAADAVDYMNGSNRTRFRKWFGSYTSSRWNRVKTVFETLKSRLDSKKLRFHCDCDDYYYAYVYPDQPYNIYICQIYWDASLEDKGGTVIHELTHFHTVGSTDDVVYGVSGCEQLARDNPGRAIENADSYAYFCELP